MENEKAVLDAHGLKTYTKFMNTLCDTKINKMKENIPIVNNAKLTIQKNGTKIQAFTANQSTDVIANIIVPTKVSDLANDSGFTTFSGDYNDLDNKPTIPTVPTDISAFTNDVGYLIEEQYKGTYNKPSTGIPKIDLDSNVQGSLNKADTALQSYTEKYTGTYSKPSGGIPKSDLASSVQTSLGLADTALQSYTEKYTGTYNKPSGGIPKSDLTNDIQTSLNKADTALQSHQDISGKENTSNKVTSWSSTTTDIHYPSEKLVKNALDGKAASSHTHTKSEISDFPTSMTPSSHNQASNTITAMTSYSKPSSTSAIAATDSLNTAIGKLEKALDGKTGNTGTITGITMNGVSKGTSGVVNLGTVLTGGSQTTTSTADGGSNVYTFSNNSTLTVKNGTKGSTGTRGNRWNTGTNITGTSTTPAVFSSSGITDALVGDLYLNATTCNLYKCTTQGNASVAKWAYVCNIQSSSAIVNSKDWQIVLY